MKTSTNIILINTNYKFINSFKIKIKLGNIYIFLNYLIDRLIDFDYNQNILYKCDYCNAVSIIWRISQENNLQFNLDVKLSLIS